MLPLEQGSLGRLTDRLTDSPYRYVCLSAGHSMPGNSASVPSYKSCRNAPPRQSIETTTTTDSPTSTSTRPRHGKSGPNVGAIVGASVGLLALAALGGGVAYHYRNKENGGAEEEAEEELVRTDA
eukprot:GHVU01149993.1.p1 GENE.GHVU01149993.1~~GHVU01149993.1.p1  ORF type:complete len:125 (+),score=18.16 GHVU01149993.1:42-416(+)